jgi:enterochelin esterase-like enzyme
MSLTGALMTWMWWLIAAATFVCGVVWPKSASVGLRGHRVRVRLRRAGMQLAVVATALVAVAGTLNSQYEWYSSWGDLGTVFGASDVAPGDPTLVVGSETTAPAPVTAGSETPGAIEPLIDGLTPDPGPGGQYRTVSVSGPLSKVSGTVVVWLPRSYTDVGSAHRTYPVIEVFHGVPGSPLEYENGMDLGGMLAGLVAGGHIRDAILVMPDITPKHVDTECVNGGSQGPAVEDWLTQDVPDWVRNHLRVEQDRESWATMGLSTGGFCSMMATMLHPQTYGAGIELGGYLTPEFDPHYRPFARGSAAWSRYDLVTLAATSPPPVQLWIETSKTDVLSYPENARLVAAASPPMRVTTDILPDAGHRMSVWIGVMPTAFQWLGSTVSGFHP